MKVVMETTPANESAVSVKSYDKNKSLNTGATNSKRYSVRSWQILKRDKRDYSKFFSCVVISGLWLFVGVKGWAAYGEYARTHEAETARPTPKISSVLSGHPQLNVTQEGLDGGDKTFDIDDDIAVTLNGEPSKLKDLKKGDSVDYKLNSDKEVVSVNARRTMSGYVLDVEPSAICITTDYLQRTQVPFAPGVKAMLGGNTIPVNSIACGDKIEVLPNKSGAAREIVKYDNSVFADCFSNFKKNLFKPLLLFFYMGFAISLLKIAFDFPQVIYQGLTIYLLVSIGWHGGEELASLSGGTLRQAMMFMGVGFLTNFAFGITAYALLRTFVKRMRQVDAATVGAYYGSDSAGTFVTCLGVLQAANIAYAAYMPVFLAIMEIPGCLVGLYLVSKLRKNGMDVLGNMPNEPGYCGANAANIPCDHPADCPEGPDNEGFELMETEMAGVAAAGMNSVFVNGSAGEAIANAPLKDASFVELMREVFLNPGLFLLFGGIVIGYVSRLQGNSVTDVDDRLFVSLFHGILCLFLLEMGMTAAKRLKDLKTCGPGIIAFGLLVPNLFAFTGMLVAHAFSFAVHTPFQLGTYALFAVLCGSASYIAVPAIQRIAIPEASPTLPLASSLGLTFSYNVTFGIPIYLAIAEQMVRTYPVV